MKITKPRYRAPFLLLVQLLLIISSAFWSEIHREILTIAIPLLMALSGVALSRSRRWLITYLALTSSSLIAAHLGDHWMLGVIRLFCHLGTFYMLFREVVQHSFFRAGVPHADRILAGMAGYLLLGLFWFVQFIATTTIQPNAILDQLTQQSPDQANLLYFSFVTLTTLGYGDLVPVTAFAKMLVLLTTLSGVLYLAIFIAALMSGAHSSKSNNLLD